PPPARRTGASGPPTGRRRATSARRSRPEDSRITSRSAAVRGRTLARPLRAILLEEYGRGPIFSAAPIVRRPPAERSKGGPGGPPFLLGASGLASDRRPSAFGIEDDGPEGHDPRDRGDHRPVARSDGLLARAHADRRRPQARAADHGR